MRTTTDRLSILAALAAAPILGVPCLADGPVPMSRIAPRDSFVVGEVADFAALRAAAEGSGLGDLWRDERVRAFIEHVSEDTLKEFTDQLARINARPEDIKPPTGRVGFALFMPADAAPGGEGGGGQGPFPEPEFLVVSDFGENSQDWRDLISRELDRAKAAGEIEFHEEDREGITITVVEDIMPAEGEGGDPEMGGGPATPDDFFLAWSGTNLAFTSARPALDSALDALGGREPDAVGESQVFTRSLRQHSGGGDPMGYSVVLFGPLAEHIRASMREGMPMPFDPAPVFSVLGLDQFESVSFGLRSVGGPDSLAEVTMGALVPEKKGLIGLVTEPIGPFDPPVFVGPDASAAMSMNFRFDGLIDVLRGAIDALPEEEKAQAGPQFEQFAALAAPALSQLGPRVEYVVSYERPLTPDSQRNLVAIRVRDQLPIANTLTTFGPGIGLQPRDFEGNTIYSGDAIPVAFGLGFGHVFIGLSGAVENAMRAASNPDAPRLATEPGFRRAAGRLSPQSVMASYADLRQEVQWLYYMAQNFEAIQAATLDGLELPPEQKEEILRSLKEQRPEWADHLPPIEVFTSRLGFSVYDLRPTPEGFFGRSILLKPE